MPTGCWGTRAALLFVFCVGFHVTKTALGPTGWPLRQQSSCIDYAVSCEIPVMLQLKGVETKSGVRSVLSLRWGLVHVQRGSFRRHGPASPPVSGQPGSSLGRQGTAAHHPLGSLLSSLGGVSPPPFSNLPPTTVKFQTFCKRIGGLYHFVQRAEARKLASRESLTVLCRITARLKNERSNRNATFHPSSAAVHLIYTQK